MLKHHRFHNNDKRVSGGDILTFHSSFLCLGGYSTSLDCHSIYVLWGRGVWADCVLPPKLYISLGRPSVMIPLEQNIANGSNCEGTLVEDRECWIIFWLSTFTLQQLMVWVAGTLLPQHNGGRCVACKENIWDPSSPGEHLRPSRTVGQFLQEEIGWHFEPWTWYHLCS